MQRVSCGETWGGNVIYIVEESSLSRGDEGHVCFVDAFGDSGSLNKNQAPSSQKVMTCDVDFDSFLSCLARSNAVI